MNKDDIKTMLHPELKATAQLNESSAVELAGGIPGMTDEYLELAQRWLDNTSGKSEPYRRYIEFVVRRGHLTPSAHSVFEDWLDKEGKSLSLADVTLALNDLWPRGTDELSKDRLKLYFKKNIKRESSVTEQGEDSTDVLQGLMDKAYDKWQKGGELEGASKDDFVDQLPEDEASAVRIGNMNYQVGNGGWDQWWGNGYGERDIGWLMDFFDDKDWDTAKKVSKILDRVASEAREGGECEECGGTGEVDEEDPETGETTYETCPVCMGSGTTEEPSFSDDLDTQYYAIDDDLMADVNRYLAGDEGNIRKGVPTGIPQEPAAPIEEEPPRPRVKLVGTDGNAFAVIGKVSQALKKAGYSKEAIANFREEAMSGDYDNLLRVAMKWVDVY